MSKGYLLRTEGGPLDGNRVVPWTWPLPDVLEDPEDRGRYRKVSESALPPEVDDMDNGVMRGAKYRWEPKGTCLHLVGKVVNPQDASEGSRCQDCGEVLPRDGTPLRTAPRGQ